MPEVYIYIIAIGTMLALIAAGAPIAFAAATAGIITYFFFQEGVKGLNVAAGVPWAQGFSYGLLAVPMFTLMGFLIEKSGAVTAIYRAFSSGIGNRMPGSIGVATLITSAALAASSGSGSATQATMAAIAWPEMKKMRYHPRLALGTIVGGGSLGPFIPPSANLILYGIITEQSVPKLYAAALLPGLACTALMIGWVVVNARLQPSLAPNPPAVPRREQVRLLIHFVPFSVVILGVLGSIYLGWATPTEAASVGVVLAALLMILYGRFSVREFVDACRQSVCTAAFVVLIIVFIQTLSSVLIYFGLADRMRDLLTGAHVSVPVFLALLVLVYFIMGMFVDGLSMMLLTLPFLAPVMRSMGIDLVWFGVLMVIMIEVGTMTPPFGLHLFIVNGITGERIETIFRGTIPFLAIWLGTILVIYLYPPIAMWLPSLMK